MPSIKIIVEVEVEKTTGKFVAKDEIAEQIVESIEGADPGSLYVDESEYEVVAWQVETA